MTGHWAVRLDPAAAPACARLRGLPGVEVLALPNALWVRGRPGHAAADRALWLLPGDRFTINDRGQLVPWNCLLPVAPAPQGNWQPVADFVALSVSPPALPGMLDTRLPLRLVRSAAERPATLLLTTLAAWAAYADTAPAIRLARLTFAADADGRVLVAGTPPPALPGVPHTLDNGIALPSGLAWQPAVPAKTVAALLALADGETALFAADATFSRIPPAAWVPATRSAVRLSAQAVSP
jgi:hypothetical protein